MKSIRIGKKSIFCIEGIFHAIEPVMMGSFTVWINGKAIGKLTEDDHHSCISAWTAIRAMAAGIFERQIISFEKLTSLEVFEVLTDFEMFCSYAESIRFQIGRRDGFDAASLFDRFKVLNSLGFDEYVVRSFTEGNNVFFLWREVGSDELFEGDVKADYLIEIIGEFSEWLEEERKALLN